MLRRNIHVHSKEWRENSKGDGDERAKVSQGKFDIKVEIPRGVIEESANSKTFATVWEESI